MRIWLSIALVGCATPAPWGVARVAEPAPQTRNLDIAVTSDGFVPADVSVARGDLVTFVFTRKVERTCVKHVIVSLDGEHQLDRELPVNQPVAVTLRFERSGELGFSCPMQMHGGTIHVTER
jgi:plastocyanin domain-containing protein